MAKVVIDPNFVSESKAKDKDAQALYNIAYDAYNNKNYNEVFSFKSKIDSNYLGTSIGPKYYYLYALSINKTKSVSDFEIALNDLINRYPSSDAASAARENLRKIAEAKNPTAEKPKFEETILYSTEKNAKYNVIITLDLAQTRETKLNLFKFNNVEFSLSRLQINTDLIGDKEQVISISTFNDIKSVQDYMLALNKKIEEVIKLKPGTYFISFISEKNFKVLKENKAIKQYLEFYNANYLINE